VADAHPKHLRGASLATAIKAEVAAGVARWKERGVAPRMAVVLASSDPAAEQYERQKARNAEKLGIALDVVSLGTQCAQAELERRVEALCADEKVHGVLLSLPLAKGLDPEPVLSLIHPHKDVDGLTPANLGLLLAAREEEAIAPTTPLACVLLAESVRPLAGARVALVGRGRTVGKGLLPLLVNRNATVTVCHSKTRDLAAVVREAEVVFVAVGRPGLVGAEHLRAGQIVVDAGINPTESGVLGDVRTDEVVDLVERITPVPGGVGPVTSSLVFRNLLRALELQQGRR
jgi:methylenetetrahydrofolate dehydrogenase (NADP+)/methenyltetrahydrofolate cyclohydrolase